VKINYSVVDCLQFCSNSEGHRLLKAANFLAVKSAAEPIYSC